MIVSSDIINGNKFIKKMKINNKNGFWCNQCQCYHPHDHYSKPTSTLIGYKLVLLNIRRR